MSTARKEEITREAAEWYVRIFEDKATLEEVNDWQRWMVQSPAHHEAFWSIPGLFEMKNVTAANLWPTLREMHGDAYDGTQPVAQWLGEEPAGGRGGERRKWWPLAIAASIALLAGVGGGLYWRLHSGLQRAPDSALLVTAPAEDREYALSDGSRMTVGARSKVGVDLNTRARNIVVDSGEAFFKVAHERRPFVVHASGGTITATGTAFNVRHLQGRVVVTVVEGSVAVREAGAAPVALLMAGEQLAYGRAPQAVHRVDPGIATAWRSGRLKYLNEPLEFVIADVARHTRERIEIGDLAANRMLYTGTVLPGEVEDWLKSVGDVLPVQAMRESDGRVVLRARAAPK